MSDLLRLDGNGGTSELTSPCSMVKLCGASRFIQNRAARDPASALLLKSAILSKTCSVSISHHAHASTYHRSPEARSKILGSNRDLLYCDAYHPERNRKLARHWRLYTTLSPMDQHPIVGDHKPPHCLWVHICP